MVLKQQDCSKVWMEYKTSRHLVQDCMLVKVLGENNCLLK